MSPAARDLLARISNLEHHPELGLTSLAALITPPATETVDTGPPIPPIRVLYDPDHVIDHNTIREALLWLVAKADEAPPPPGPSTWG